MESSTVEVGTPNRDSISSTNFNQLTQPSHLSGITNQFA